jgi:hypothetical protein
MAVGVIAAAPGVDLLGLFARGKCILLMPEKAAGPGNALNLYLQFCGGSIAGVLILGSSLQPNQTLMETVWLSIEIVWSPQCLNQAVPVDHSSC